MKDIKELNSKIEKLNKLLIFKNIELLLTFFIFVAVTITYIVSYFLTGAVLFSSVWILGTFLLFKSTAASCKMLQLSISSLITNVAMYETLKALTED